MNLALWLERAGRAAPNAPAIGLGERIVQDYGTLAGRAARLAGVYVVPGAPEEDAEAPLAPRPDDNAGGRD